jgi:hypothetical protein
MGGGHSDTEALYCAPPLAYLGHSLPREVRGGDVGALWRQAGRGLGRHDAHRVRVRDVVGAREVGREAQRRVVDDSHVALHVLTEKV